QGAVLCGAECAPRTPAHLRLRPLLRSEYRDDALAGARRQAAGDQLLPVADGDDDVVISDRLCRSAAMAGRPVALDRACRVAVDDRHAPFRLGLCARARELSS